MRKSILVFVLVIALSNIVQAGNDSTSLFTGGMLLHSGYIKNNNSSYQVDGLCFGLGGKLAFHIGNHLRLGSEGFSSNINYQNNDGYYKLGYGGLLIEYQFLPKKVTPVLGFAVGAGTIKDLYVLQGSIDDNKSDEVIYKVYSVLLVTPSLSLEYALSEKIKIALRLDYIINLTDEYQNDFASGSRIHLGVLFGK